MSTSEVDLFKDRGSMILVCDLTSVHS